MTVESIVARWVVAGHLTEKDAAAHVVPRLKQLFQSGLVPAEKTEEFCAQYLRSLKKAEAMPAKEYQRRKRVLRKARAEVERMTPAERQEMFRKLREGK